jgi:6-pyruvoyl-tetrahydropterin synthase
MTYAIAETFYTLQGVDFGEIKQKLGAWIDDHLDHTTAYQRGDELMESMARLNDEHGLKPFFPMSAPPTAEALAELLLRVASDMLDAEVVRVVVHETPNCSASWSP